MCYTPRVYSGLDKFTLLLAGKLEKADYHNVFLFYDTMENAPAYRRALLANGHIVVLLPSQAGKWKLLKEYFRCFRKYKPAIVHVHFTALSKLFNAFLRLFYRFKLFVSFHSTVNPYASYKEYREKKGYVKTLLYTFYCRFIYRRSTAVICVSRAVEHQYRQFLRGAGRKVVCLYLGVAATRTRRDEALGKLRSDARPLFRICHISAFEPLKGIDVIIRAAYILKEEYRIADFKIYLIGSDRRNDGYTRSMKEMADALGVADHLVWMGKRSDIQEILPAFDTYVHPSRFEALGVALMEASSAGLPLIGTCVGGIPEIVVHGSNGFLIQNESAPQLASSLCRLYRDETLRHNMAARSCERWNALFDADKQTNKLYRLYINT